MRDYLTTTEASKYLNIPVKTIHKLIKERKIKAERSPSGKYRISMHEIKKYEKKYGIEIDEEYKKIENPCIVNINGTTQKIYIKSATNMSEIEDESIHLVITSPPYFNVKLYNRQPHEDDLGNIHDIDMWFEKMNQVWKEVFRVLQSGRRAFINIANISMKTKNKSYRTLNIVGKTIDMLEKIGFIFKQDIIWKKTNSARANLGSYLYPGGILINNMHEYILGFEKPAKRRKYNHITKEIKEKSKMEKDFWLEITKSSVWTMNPERSGDGRIHVAPFPYELPYRIIKAFSFITETVLDPFVGSGTTLLACANLGRNGIGYELYPEIAYLLLKRLKIY